MTPTRISRITALAAPALAAVLLLGGCGLNSPDEVLSPGSDAPAAEESTPEPEPPQEDAPETDDEAPTGGTETGSADSDRIDPVAAGEIALEAHTDGRVYEVELERSHGTTVWEVKIVTSDAVFEVDVDAVSGEVLRDRDVRTSSLAKYNHRLDGAELTYADAIDAILDVHPGATLVELELDEEHGAVVWEAEIVTSDHVEYDLEIHASTGEVLKNEIDD